MTFAIAALALGNFAVGMGTYLVIGLLVPIARDMNVSEADAGLLMVVYAGVYALTSPFLVNLTAPGPRRLILIASLLLVSAGVCLTSWSHNWPLILVGRAITAVGAAIYTPIASSTAFTLSSSQQRGRNLSIVFFGLTLSQAAGMPISIMIERHFGWEMALQLVLVFAALALAAICLTIPTRAGATLFRADFTLLLRNVPVILGLLTTVIHIAAYCAVYTYMSPLVDAIGTSDVFTMLAILGVSAAIGGLAIGWVPDRFSSRTILSVIMLGEAATLPIFSFSGTPAALLLPAAAITAFFSSAFMVPQQMQLVRYAPHHQSLVLALNATAIYVGITLGSGIGSIIVRQAGLLSLGISAAAIALLGVAILQVFSPRP